jgi:hypothetical protein
MTTYPPAPFPGKGVTVVQPLRGFRAFGVSPPPGRPQKG